MAKRSTKAGLASKLFDKMPVPPAETKEGRKRQRQYERALGAFVTAFAKVEAGMHLALRYHAKMDEGRARALFSGVRALEAAGNLKRLADIGLISPPEWTVLDPLVAHLTAINTVRNVILHYGADKIPEGEGIATDARIALTPERARSFPVSADILFEMTLDLQMIYARLLVRHVGRPPPVGKHPRLEKLLNDAWLYKPPQPTKKDRQKGKMGSGGSK